jgi:Domain of unknown function (DUF4123)
MVDTQTVLSAQQIYERLFNAGLQHSNVYLLLDRFTEYPLQDEIQSLPDADELCWPLLDSLFEDSPQQSPMLVQLHRSSPEHQAIVLSSITQALEQSNASLRSICGWIYTYEEPQRLQSALTQRLTAHWPNNQSIYLRYFDPRVMPRLMHILPPAHQAQLLGPVHTWCQLGRDGQWLSHSPPANLPISLIGGLRPSAAHAQAIDRVELINITAAQLVSQGHAVPHSQDAAIDEALQKAHQLSIKIDEDKLAYAWRAVAYKNKFTAHASLADCIANALSSGLPLDTLFDEQMKLETI